MGVHTAMNTAPTLAPGRPRRGQGFGGTRGDEGAVRCPVPLGEPPTATLVLPGRLLLTGPVETAPLPLLPSVAWLTCPVAAHNPTSRAACRGSSALLPSPRADPEWSNPLFHSLPLPGRAHARDHAGQGSELSPHDAARRPVTCVGDSVQGRGRGGHHELLRGRGSKAPALASPGWT